jgi:hypothetical protein
MTLDTRPTAITWLPTGTARLLPEGQTLCFRSFRAGWRAAARGVSLADAEKRATNRSVRNRNRAEYMRGWYEGNSAGLDKGVS